MQEESLIPKKLKEIYDACPYPDSPQEGLGKQLKDYAVYVGEFRDGKMHGQGKLTYHNGGEYVGEFCDGKMSGAGREHFSDGNYFKGQYSDGAPVEGTIFFFDGIVYHGKVNYQPAPSGEGEMLFPNGIRKIAVGFKRYDGGTSLTDADAMRYVGKFALNSYDGYGELTFRDGCVYRGNFHVGNIHGCGVFFFADGRKYAGEFYYGKRHGNGKETYPDGSYYEGEFRDDVREGYGVLRLPDGSVREGLFRGGEFVG